MGTNILQKKHSMPKVFELGDINPEFKNKIFTIADEVLKILKELSLENKSEITSSQIAERMFWKESLTGLLNDIKAITSDDKIESASLKSLSNVLLDKFTELMPQYMTKKLNDLKDALHNSELAGSPEEWIDLPLEVVKNYIDSISTRNTELENFLSISMERLSGTDECMSKELSLQKQRYHEDIIFEKSIESNIDELKQRILNDPNDLRNIKKEIINKLEGLNIRMEGKRMQNIQYIKETEKTLDVLNRRMSEIKREAGEIQRKSKRTEYEATHDALTGVHNRKSFEKKMREILSDVRRYGIAASLMICDIDLFMKLNDRCGHKVGDLGLRTLASIIKNRMRTNDFITRFGGEEFAIILPHTDLEGALIAGDRLRAYIDRVDFTYMDDDLPMTVSIGISSFRKKDRMKSVIKRAEQALLLAKNSGRNAVKTEEDNAVVK